MTKKARAILEQALKLTLAERTEVIEGLATSIRIEDDPDLAPARWEEIERRIERILSGETKGIPIGKAMKTLRSSLERHRRARGKASPR